ncbi:putative N-methyltryptophan oxidase, FAD-binding [Ralstonia solanacearum CMR15]|nr:putative N-methyltryptophan oxidase, FAD-binding [Ralstonia solanacearum CMR15]
MKLTSDVIHDNAPILAEGIAGHALAKASVIGTCTRNPSPAEKS